MEKKQNQKPAHSETADQMVAANTKNKGAKAKGKSCKSDKCCCG